MLKKICFRADGNEKIGYGHIMRCLALVEMLRDTFSCCFITRDPPHILMDEIKTTCHTYHILPKVVEESTYDVEFISKKCDQNSIIVVDGYHFDDQYQKKLKAEGFIVVAIDDHQPFHYYADLVINHSTEINKSSFSLEPYTELRVGPDYAMLRTPFLSEAKGEYSTKLSLSAVLICFGGADPHSLAYKSLQICLSLEFKHIVIVTTANNKSRNNFGQLASNKRVTFYENLNSVEILELMKQADLGICPSSTISFEACAARLPICTGYYVDNQKKIYDGLIKNQAAIALGNLLNWDDKKIKDILFSLIEDIPKVNQIIRNQSKFIDGYSSERIRQLFKAIVN